MCRIPSQKGGQASTQTENMSSAEKLENRTIRFFVFAVALSCPQFAQFAAVCSDKMLCARIVRIPRTWDDGSGSTSALEIRNGLEEHMPAGHSVRRDRERENAEKWFAGKWRRDERKKHIYEKLLWTNKQNKRNGMKGKMSKTQCELQACSMLELIKTEAFYLYTQNV